MGRESNPVGGVGLDWYGSERCQQLPAVTDVICGDVYDQIGRFGTKTKHLLDIWKLYGECLDDEWFRWHKRRFRHVWGWGEEAAAWGLANTKGTLASTECGESDQVLQAKKGDLLCRHE